MARKKFVPVLVTDLSDVQRLEILNENAVLEGSEWKSVDSKKFCHHCDKEFSGRDVRIFKNSEFPGGHEVQCGTEGCDGSPLDWSEKPWWRGEN